MAISLFWLAVLVIIGFFILSAIFKILPQPVKDVLSDFLHDLLFGG
jgi:hypothetical protein